MKVAVGTVEVDERFRKALRIKYGMSGLATREDVRKWAVNLIRDEEQEILSNLKFAEFLADQHGIKPIERGEEDIDAEGDSD